MWGVSLRASVTYSVKKSRAATKALLIGWKRIKYLGAKSARQAMIGPAN